MNSTYMRPQYGRFSIAHPFGISHNLSSPGRRGILSIPEGDIKTNQWDESRPGFLEADTVAHCGDFTAGMYVNTIDLVDIATGWTEQRAVWGKGETEALKQIKHIEKTRPFPNFGFDCDNDGEFLNYHLLRHFTHRKQPVHFTQSIAHHKDDNVHTEQKNWTHIRQWLGYDRLDMKKLVPPLNNLSTKEWRLFLNFFCLSVKLIAKQRLSSKTIKRYDPPKASYQRIMESHYISEPIKLSLSKQLENLNLFLLRKIMDKKMKRIFSINNKLR